MRLNEYRLLSQLGAGPDGISYRAAAPGGATVEIRNIDRAQSDRQRWVRLVSRVRLAARLEHPAAVAVRDSDLEGPLPFVAMESIGATTLAEHYLGAGPVQSAEAAKIASVLASALEEAHRLGVAHGRLGPGQVLLAEGQPKLDFTGIDAGSPAGSTASRALDADCRDPAFLVGAGASVREAAERESDIYALGVTLAWLLTGKTAQAARSAFAEGQGIDPSLGTLIRDMLASEPADRPTAREVIERLRGAAPTLADRETINYPEEISDTLEWSRAVPPKILPTELSGDQRMAATATLDLEPVMVNSGKDPSVAGTWLGRYHLLDKLGEGGQGTVYRAADPANGSIVAIKVLRAERARNAIGMRRFRKEARLMAEANNPHVVNLLEYNEENGIPYLVLEFVSGEGLDQLLQRRRQLSEREALAILAEVARGLASAHERGIVHRDIKPSNILVLEHVEPDGPNAPPRIKISDFGLARHVVDSASLALTTAGALMGTPHYMAPEQWTGRGVDARTDVYALGITLYHLIAGHPPFEGTTHDELAAQHCHTPPSFPSPWPGVSEAVASVMMRAMAKQPEDRYIDAGAMYRDLEALLHGEPTGIPVHPVLPSCPPERMLEVTFRWDLESSPRALWPLVTNTDRLDRAVGFSAVRYTTQYDEGRVRTFSEGRKAGLAEVGEEYPYEWVEPRRMGVLREYTQGPFVWVVSTVELLPKAGGGTTLVHHLQFEPRTWVTRIGSRWVVGVALRKSLDKVYRRIDSTIQARERLGGFAIGPSAAADPFETAERLPALRRQRFETLLDKVAARGVGPLVVERLGEFLAVASRSDVARIRPLALADRLGLDPDEVVAACLHSTREGLLELYWDLICPSCRISTRVTNTLRAIEDHAHCVPCHRDYQPDFAASIEMIFQVHPEIRRADNGVFRLGGPPHSPHVLVQVRMAPGERIELDLALPEGAYRLRGLQLAWDVDFTTKGTTGSRRWEVELAAGRTPDAPVALPAGAQVLVLTNRHDRELVIRVERTAPREDAMTAARAASLALFRELFPGEVLAPGLLATVSTVTFLVTALDPSQADALYRTKGDAQAVAVIRQHFRLLGDAIRQGGGAVIKTHGEGLVASFADVTAAYRTAMLLPQTLTAEQSTRPLAPDGRRPPRLRPRRDRERPTRLLRHHRPPGLASPRPRPPRRPPPHPTRRLRPRSRRPPQ